MPVEIPDRGRGSIIHARAWASLGFPVFPVSTWMPDGRWSKAPACPSPEHGGPVAPDRIVGLDREKGGHHQASINERHIHEMWMSRPDVSSLLTASPLPAHVVCWDWDRPEADWLAFHPDLAEVYLRQRERTFVVRTQDAERYHVYFRLPEGVVVPARFPGAGGGPPDNIRHYADIKGATSRQDLKAGYIVLPNQQRPDGKGAYTGVHGDPANLAVMDPRLVAHLIDGAVPVAAPTGRAAASLRPSTYSSGDSSHWVTDIIHEGGREPHLHGLAWSQDWASYDEMLIVMRGVNAANFRPHHPDGRIIEIARREWGAYQERQPAPEAETEPEPQSEP